MEIVDFRTKTFSEIPKQDNPAYSDDECILICKAEKSQTGCYVVMKIEENNQDEDEVAQLGLFWNIEMALLFAELIKPNSNLTPKIKKEDKVTWSNAGWWQLPLT